MKWRKEREGMMRMLKPYITVRCAKDWKHEVVFEREYIPAHEVQGGEIGCSFIDETGKTTTVIYRAIKRTDDGSWVYRLDKRTIRYMKRARVAA